MKKFIDDRTVLRKVIFFVLAALCLAPFSSAPVALVLGFVLAQTVGNPYEEFSKKMIHWLLQAAIIGLGFGMNAETAMKAGGEAFVLSSVSIVIVLVAGFFLAKAFKIEKPTGHLISAGTAICGGSAIAAISPVIKAKPHQISVALAVVFALNSLALLIFPVIGRYLHLSQHDFGLWCAIAIHDTSSVVGASSKYGAEALEIATTAKLARALWIIPVSVVSALIFNNGGYKIKIPWFIAFYILAMLLNTYFAIPAVIGSSIVKIAKLALMLTLFLIGAGLSMEVLKKVGMKPLLLALILWISISVGTLVFIIS